jgi:alanine racemase
LLAQGSSCQLIHSTDQADAYGHGAAEVAAAALSAGAKLLAVATVDEGIELRLSELVPPGIPILVMGLVGHGVEESYFQYNLIPTIHSIRSAERIANVAIRLKNHIKVHLKIDTGMGRVGIRPKDMKEFATTVIAKQGGKQGWSQHITIEGVFTHFSKADERDKDYSKKQTAEFFECIDVLKEHGITPEVIHLANSAGSMESPDIFNSKEHHPHTHSMLRLGISLYGYYPSDEVNKKRVSLKPVMSWKTKVVQVRSLLTRPL